MRDFFENILDVIFDDWIFVCCTATKRQDDWRPEQNSGSWTGGSSTMGSERTSRGNTVQGGASFSTQSWQVSAGRTGMPSQQPVTKKPDEPSYIQTNVIDEPNQQGLAQTGAGPRPNVPGAVTVTVPVLLVLTRIAAL